MNPLQGLQIPTPAMPPSPPPSTAQIAKGESSFTDILLQGIDQVNSMQHNADLAVQNLVTGEDVDPAMVLTTIQKADMSFRLMTQIRNKLMQAYQEVKEMRI